MIEVYIPRKKFYFNQNHTIINPEGLVLYEHKSSLFQGKLSLFKDHQLIYTSDQFFSFFKRRYDIKRHQETLCRVTEKWKFFSLAISHRNRDWESLFYQLEKYIGKIFKFLMEISWFYPSEEMNTKSITESFK
jgi:uncharacterized protein YxjI